jgi:hypothetical protein
MTSGLVFTFIIAALAATGGIVGNWIKPPKNLPQRAILALTVIVVIAGPSIAFYLGSREASAAPLITAPVQNARVDRETYLEGVLSKTLPGGHELWYEIHSYDENGLHFAEDACDIIGGSWRCPTVYVGEPDDPAGKKFVITMLDCDAVGASTLKGPSYAGRDKDGPNAFAAQPMVQGCIAVASVVVKRR